MSVLDIGTEPNPLQPAFRTDPFPIRYPTAMTLCVGAQFSRGPKRPDGIILCSDTRIDYGPGLGAHDGAFKLSIAGLGWFALMAGAQSRCRALLSLYQKSLDGRKLTAENVWHEMQKPLTEYKRAIGSAGFPKGKRVELLLTGFIDNSPHIFKVSASDDPDEETYEVDDYGCIGSGYHLAHYALINRRYSARMSPQEAIYCVYEAKRWAELETGVSKQTYMFVQVPSSTPGGMVIEALEPGAIERLAKMYKKLGPQPFNDCGIASSEIYRIRDQESL